MSAPVRDDMTAEELRAVLADVLDELLAGRITPAMANAKVRQVRQRLAVVAAALRTARMIKRP